MKYKNATEILPEQLLQEIQKYISGDILYIPQKGEKKQWGASSGARRFYLERNQRIKEAFKEGNSMEELAEQYGLSYSTIKRIVYN